MYMFGKKCTFTRNALLFQPDNSSAQYVLRMMVQQHMFFRTEYDYVKWVANGHRYVDRIMY